LGDNLQTTGMERTRVGLAYVTVTVAGATMLAQKPQICPCRCAVVPQRTTYTQKHIYILYIYRYI